MNDETGDCKILQTFGLLLTMRCWPVPIIGTLFDWVKDWFGVSDTRFWSEVVIKSWDLEKITTHGGWGCHPPWHSRISLLMKLTYLVMEIQLTYLGCARWKLLFFRSINRISPKSSFHRKYPWYDDFTVNFEIMITWFLRTAPTEFQKDHRETQGV